MSDTQSRRDGSLPRPFGISLMRHKKASGGEGVLEAPSPKVRSKPFRESPDPYQHAFKDFDIPSLTTGSSRGSRTSSVVTDCEHSNIVLDWPTSNTAVPYSCDSQSIAVPNPPIGAPFAARDTNEGIGTSAPAPDHEGLDLRNDITRVPTTTIMTASNDQCCTSAIIVNRKTPKLTGNLEAEKSDAESSIDSEGVDEDDNADEDSNDSWSLHIHILEAAALEAFAGDLDLAAFFLSNLNEVLGLHNSRDISKQKVKSWIPGIKYSPNSSDTGSGQTQSSYESQSTSNSSGQNRKRQRSVNRRHPEGRGDRGEDEEDQKERDSKKLKENEPGDKSDGALLLACPFWKQNPTKYNAHYHPDANSRRGKYRTCEAPGFTNMQRLKEHLKRVHIHVQCQRCGTVLDGSDHTIRAKKLEEHQRLEVPCQLKPETEIVKEGISDHQWADLTKQANKKSKGNSCPLPKNTVEKWNEIWVVLFADIQAPSNPWHPRQDSQAQSVVLGDSPVGSFQKLFEAALHRKVETGDISMNDVTISRVVDVAAQTLVFSISRGIQDLNLGTSLGLQHSSDYGSFLGGSYLEIPPSSTGTAIRDQNIDHLSNLDAGSQRAPQTDMPPGAHANGSPVANVDQMYTQGIDHNVVPAPNTDSGAMDQFEPFHPGTLMQRAISGQYIHPFDSTPSFGNGYQLNRDTTYPTPADAFYHNDLHSYGAQNQNNTRHALYQNRTTMQPSNGAQYRNTGEFCHPPHDQRR